MTKWKKKKKVVTIHAQAHALPFHVLTKCWHSSLYSCWSVQCVGSGHWPATAWAQKEVLWQLRWEIQMRSNGGQHNWFIHRPSTIQLISDICYIYHLLSTLTLQLRCGLLLYTQWWFFIFFLSMKYILPLCCCIESDPRCGPSPVSRVMVRYTLRWAWWMVVRVLKCDIDIHNIQRISLAQWCLTVWKDLH